MGLTDLFRPKYRHSDAAVRADAVRQMGADEVDLVARIAREDRDASVRRIAIDRIEDPAILAEIAAKEPDPGLRDHARARAADLWVTHAAGADGLEAAHDALGGLIRIGDQRSLAEVAERADNPAVRDVALSKLTEPRALADLARSASAHASTRQAALGRIKDGDVLRAIAVDEQRKDLALAALERIDDVDTLETIAVKAKVKAVRTRARKRLAELAAPSAETARAEAAPPAEIPEERRRHAERVQLLHRVETLARGEEWEQSAAEMADIEKQWTALGPSEQAEQAGRFESARTRYHARRKAHVRATAEKPARQKPAESRPAAPAAAPSRDAAPAAEQPAGAQAAAPAASEPTGATEAAATSGSTGAAEAAATSEPGGEPAPARTVEDEPARLARQEAEQARESRRAEDLATLGQMSRDIERLAEATKTKQVERTLERADKVFKELQLPPGDEARAARERFQAARHAALIKAQELREAEDWERWANVPRQEALIAKAEAMLAEPDDSKLSDRLKDLQNEWRNVGPVPQKKSRELWERFKVACDKVYERIKGVRSRATEEMQANLARKEALCEQAETLAESTEWERTAEEIKQLQNEWKTIGPVPRKRSDAVWKRFRAACDRFFERRKPYLEEMLAELTQNLEKKEAMCAQAEALADSTDWKEASLQLRDLQGDWRRIGPVPRKDMNAVNKRFRAACDHFFERRDQQRQAEREAQDRALDGLRAELRAIVEGAPAVALPEVAAEQAGGDAGSESGQPESGQPEPGESEPGQPATPAERLLHVRHALRDLSLTTAQQDELYQLINDAALKLLEDSPELFRGTELDPVSSRQRKQKLCARAEELAPAPQTKRTTSEELTPESMAERLRAALAQNALSSSLAVSTDGRNIVDTIVELEASWWRLGPVPGAEGKDLEARFLAACERARQSVGQQGDA